MAELSDSLTSRDRDWLALAGRVARPLLLMMAGMAVYANSLSGVFLFDDTLHIVDNPAIRQLWPLDRLALSSRSRPLLPITLAVNYSLGGLDVTGYHLFNIAVHVSAGLALYGVVRRTLRLPSLADHFVHTADWLAFVVALFWIVHPLQTQAVTYIVQRCEAMMALFFLLTMYGYVRGATSSRRWAWLWYGLTFVAYCLGLASKEVMVMVLPVLWLFDRCFLVPSWRELLRRRGWLHLVLAAPLAVAATVIVPGLLGGDRTTGFEIQAVTPWEYARSQPGVILHYLRLVVWPCPQCLDYGWPIENRWVSGIMVPGMLVLGLLASSLWALGRGRRIGFVGVAFFLILAPTSSCMPIQDLCFEHRMYLPLACALTAVVLGGYEILRRWPPRWHPASSLAVVTCVVLVFGGLTVARNRVYHSAVAMWTDVIQKSRSYCTAFSLARAMGNLGDALLDVGRIEEGVEVLKNAAKLRPDMPEIRGNLGRGLMELGDFEAARQHCEAAVQRSPNHARFRQQLGLLAAAERRWADAEQQLRAAVQLSPQDAVVKTNLAQCLAEQGRSQEALRCLEEVLEADPHFTDARQRLATTLAAAGRWSEATDHARELARQSPDDARPHLLMGLIEIQRENDRAALQHLDKARQLDPRLATAHLQAGNVQRRLGERRAALRSYEQAISVDEDLAEAHNNLGGLLAQDEPARAAGHFGRAVRACPDFLEARFNLAGALVRLGRRAEAIKEYQAVLRLKPDFAPAQAGLDALLGQAAAVEAPRRQ
jgi:tetratricopeptide (TPR) repeat protein